MPNVRDFYADKTIFITGVTGFLGQVLLWKLLRSCPEIRRIYTLIREKKGKSVDCRIEQIFQDTIFSFTKQNRLEYVSKVKPIKGDCSFDKLGISDEDRIILETEVDIVFHAAASVLFDDGLREAAHTNIRSTDILLDMAKNMKNLKAFVYVSTAFAPCARNVFVEEKFYDPPIKARDLFTMIDQLDDKSLARMTPKLTSPHPNTYIFTKLIAENLCQEKGDGLPLSVFRPAIVSPCHQEPLVGWLNNVNGPIGVVAGYAMGILKVVHVDENCISDVVPCDYTINALIVIAYRTSLLWQNSVANGSTYQIPIFNYSSTTTKLNLTWRRFSTICKKLWDKYPSYNMITSPFLKTVRNPIIFQFLATTLHTFPAYVMDGILYVSRKQLRFIDLLRKINKLLELISYFSTRDWIIPNTNLNELHDSLSETDQRTFNYDLNTLCSEKYCESLVLGVRQFIMKEDTETVGKAIKRHKIIFTLQYSLITIVFLAIACSLIKFIFL